MALIYRVARFQDLISQQLLPGVLVVIVRIYLAVVAWLVIFHILQTRAALAKTIAVILAIAPRAELGLGTLDTLAEERVLNECEVGWQRVDLLLAPQDLERRPRRPEVDWVLLPVGES